MTNMVDLIFNACNMPLNDEDVLTDIVDAEEAKKKYAEAKKAVRRKGLERFTVEEQKEILSEISYMLDFSKGFNSFVAAKEFPDLVPGVSTIGNLPENLQLFFGLDYEDLPLLLNFDDQFTVYVEIKEKIVGWRLLKGK